MKEDHESESNLDLFYSKNPYEVLGVSHDATLEEINNAKKELLKTFHPDVNPGLTSTEISQNILHAFDLLKYRAEKPKESHNPERSYKEPVHQPSENEKREQKRQKEHEEKLEKEKEDFFDALKNGAKNFKEYISDAKSRGVDFDELCEAINSGPTDIQFLFEFNEKVRKILLEQLDEFISSIGDNVGRIREFINDWQSVYEFGYDKFMDSFVGYHLSLMAKEIIQNNDYSQPEEFFKFVNKWKKADIDLTYMLNPYEDVEDDEINSGIRDAAWRRITNLRNGDPTSERFALQIYADFVKRWMNAGWEANIMLEYPLEEIEKVPSQV